MKKLALISALAMTAFAAPAVADVNGAIAHFNESLNPGEQVKLRPAGEERVTVSTQSGGNVATAIAKFNGSLDAGDKLRADSVTIVSGQPAYAADIFAQLRAADDTN